MNVTARTILIRQHSDEELKQSFDLFRCSSRCIWKCSSAVHSLKRVLKN